MRSRASRVNSGVLVVNLTNLDLDEMQNMLETVTMAEDFSLAPSAAFSSLQQPSRGKAVEGLTKVTNFPVA